MATDKLKQYLGRLDDLRDELFLEYKRVSGLKLQAAQPIAGSLQQVENALKIDVMMVTNLRKELTNYFTDIYEQFKQELNEKLSTKEEEVESQLDHALSNIDKLKSEMHFEEDKLANDIQTEIEEKYKKREEALVMKLKTKRQDDLLKFKEQLKDREELMKQDLMTQIQSVDKLREDINSSSQTLEDSLREELLKDTKKRERDLIKDLETRMESELTNLDSKYKSRVDILENELQRAQKKIKELRNLNI